MTSFLENTARFLVARYGEKLSKVVVVLPNRRAGLFLRRHIATSLKKPVWSPSFFSIEDFITKISGLSEIGTLPLLFELYEVHKEVEREKAHPFEEFLQWAPQLVSDFNEIDRYLVDPQQLFGYLDAARMITVWNPENTPLTELQERYIRFYHSLYEYYTRLTERLLAKHQGYQGLIFRHAAGIANEVVHSFPWDSVVFAGFSAMTKAEEQIIDILRTHHKAELLWDADPYYLDNEQQEAGTFLRQWLRKWPSKDPLWISDDFASSEKEIRIIGSPDPIGQVKHAASLLSRLSNEGKANERTAVVLLEESLLIPLLNSLPESLGELNITAGFPLRQTPQADLFEGLFRLQLNRTKFRYLASRDIRKFYFKDVLKVLMHPLVQQMVSHYAGENRFVFDEAVDRVRNGSRIFIGKEDLDSPGAGLFNSGMPFLDALLTPWETSAKAVASFRELIGTLREVSASRLPGGDPDPSSAARFDLEYLFAFTKIFHQLSGLTTGFPGELTLQTLYKLFRQVTDTTSLPFYGEPLKGIQVMGMLETRTLDFDQVILLSCNEDLLPSSKVMPSFIPFDVKVRFGLPTYRHKDAVYAYHFYRLLQRAKNADILYGTEPDMLGGGDRSRFIKQIRQELGAYNSRIRITEALLPASPVKGEVTPPISIPKEGDVKRLLEEKASKGLSATSLNAFRTCPLRFYFSEIAGLREPDETEETISASVLGSAVHEALAALYRPCIDHPITAGEIIRMERSYASEVDKAFREKFRGSDTAYGKNLLFVSVAKLLVRRLLASEKKGLEKITTEGSPVTLKFIEQYFEHTLGIPYAGGMLEVRLKGFVDRVDTRGSLWRIIDYKTGTTVQKSMNIKDWGDLRDDPGLNIGFQLLMYAWLMNRRFRNPVAIEAGIIPIRKITSGFMSVEVPGGHGPLRTEDLDRFAEVLEGILSDIFDLSQPFGQTSDPDRCIYCPFVNLCCR
jgi:ATP-dependent helicase/nuclease subunit B